MILSAAAVLVLSQRCVPNIAPQTVAAVVMTESAGQVFAINVNGGPRLTPQRSATAAASAARRFVAAGYTVDLGLGQINSRNMRRLGLTWETVFDPCTNLKALGQILAQNFQSVLAGREPQTALRIAFSLYNTGSPSRGFRNGYVGRVVGNAGVSDQPELDPSVSTIGSDDGRFAIVADGSAVATPSAATDAMPPAWNVFARADYARRAALPSSPIRSRSVWSE